MDAWEVKHGSKLHVIKALYIHRNPMYMTVGEGHSFTQLIKTGIQTQNKNTSCWDILSIKTTQIKL